MTTIRTTRPTLALPVALLLAVALLAVVLLAGCGGPASTVFKSAAPTQAIIPGMVGSNYAGPATVVGLRGTDGTEAWRTVIGARGIDARAAMHDGVLYIAATPASTTPSLQPPSSGFVLALRLSDGTVRWRTPLPQLDFNVDITTDGATIYAAAQRGGLYALDPANGAIRWHVAATAFGPALIMHDAVLVSVGDTSPTGGIAGIAAYRERDGALLWQSGQTGSVVTDALGAYFTTADDTTALAAADGHSRWTYTSGATADGGFPHPSQVIGASDALVLVQVSFPVTSDSAPSKDYLAALDAQTGQVVWNSSPGFEGGDVYGAQLFATPTPGQTFIYGNYKTQVVVLRGADGTQIWTADLAPYSLQQLTYADGVLFALVSPPACDWICWSQPTNLRMEALDGATGAIYWERDVPGVVMLAGE